MTLRTIQNGTTLSKMVASYNREFNAKLTVAEVAQANGIKDANKIQAGGTLIFPDKFETTAPTQVVRNAQGGKTVRNAVSEQVEVRGGPDAPVKSEPGKISTTVQNRPLEKLPEAPRPVKAKTEQPITTEPAKISTTVQNRPLEKLPEAPRPVKTEQPLTTEPGKISTTVQNRPLEKLPEAPKPVKTEQPLTTEPAKFSTTVQNRPLEQLPEASKPVKTSPEPQKTTLSLSEFLAANKDQKLSVDSLRRSGVGAASSDLNGDGVIAGEKELGALFSTAEKADSNKDKTVADLTNSTVAQNFERIGSARRLDVAPYSQVDLDRVKQTLKEGTAERLQNVSPEDAKSRGLSPGSTQFTVSTGVDETRGMGNRINNVTIYRDAKTGQYFKEYNNDADGKNTPLVPLTAAEKELVRRLDASQLGGSGPHQQAMLNELFSFDGDV